jgi:hypothetical protein
MEGSEAGTMDGKTPIKRAFGPSDDKRRSRRRRVASNAGEQTETLRARLIAATVEVLAQGSHPRLDRTAYTRTVA